MDANGRIMDWRGTPGQWAQIGGRIMRDAAPVGMQVTEPPAAPQAAAAVPSAQAPAQPDFWRQLHDGYQAAVDYLVTPNARLGGLRPWSMISSGLAQIAQGPNGGWQAGVQTMRGMEENFDAPAQREFDRQAKAKQVEQGDRQAAVQERQAAVQERRLAQDDRQFGATQQQRERHFQQNLSLEGRRLDHVMRAHVESNELGWAQLNAHSQGTARTNDFARFRNEDWMTASPETLAIGEHFAKGAMVTVRDANGQPAVVNALEHFTKSATDIVRAMIEEGTLTQTVRGKQVPITPQDWNTYQDVIEGKASSPAARATFSSLLERIRRVRMGLIQRQDPEFDKQKTQPAASPFLTQ